MDQFTGDTHSEMLHLYVDGELEQAHEPELFSELTHSEELRTEMRELLAIRSCVSNDSEAFAAPVESTGIIFNRVGLTPPFVPPPPPVLQPAAATGGAFLTTLFRNFWAPALVAVISIIGTSLILTNRYNNEIGQLNDQIARTQSFDKQSKNVKPSSSENSAFTNNIAQKPKVVTVYKTVFVPAAQQKNQLLSEGSVSENKNVETLNKSDFVDTHSFVLLPVSNFYSLIAPVNHLRTSGMATETGEKKYSVYLKGMSAKSYPAVDMGQTSDPIFTNMSIGGYISNSPNMQFGLEVGQEAFSQVFTNVENGNHYQYMQNPVIFWGALGALAKTNKMAYLAGAQPFAQLLLGGSQLGPLGKMLIGVQMNSDEMGIGILAGLEGSVLFYQNQSVWYTTRKLGFTFGTAINF